MLSCFVSALRSSVSDRKGVTAAEYAILAVGIVIVVGAAATAFRQPLIDAFTGIGTQITATQGTVGAAAAR